MAWFAPHGAGSRTPEIRPWPWSRFDLAYNAAHALALAVYKAMLRLGPIGSEEG
jgi:hypothetical protein